jgi:hypothetical protein
MPCSDDSVESNIDLKDGIILTRVSDTKFGNKGRCGGAFCMNENLTDYHETKIWIATYYE